MFNTETTTFKTGGAFYEKGDTSWKHPSEFGRVSAWVKRTKNDLALEKEIYGHPPSIVFEIQAPKFIGVQAVDPPDGFEPPGQGRAYVEAPDGTPTIRLPQRRKEHQQRRRLLPIMVLIAVVQEIKPLGQKRFGSRRFSFLTSKPPC
jgi:hypothetical protein